MADFKKLKDGEGNSYNVKDETARTNLASHTGSTSNPHSVTKAQVGLGNVDNTSDENKPISNAQALVNATKFDKANVKSTPSATPSDDNVLSEKAVDSALTALENGLGETNIEIDKINESFEIKYIDTINVLDLVNLVSGKYANPSNGVISDSESFSITENIPLVETDKLFMAYTNNAIMNYTAVCFYNDSTFLSGYTPEITSQEDKAEYGGYRGVFLNIPAGTTHAIVNIINTRLSVSVLLKEPTNKEKKSIMIPKLQYSKLYGKKLVNFGDSIFGNYRDTDDTVDLSISKMMEEKTGAICYNAGFGGCTMTNHSDFWDPFTMHALADSIASGNWDAQDEALISGEGTLPEYFVNTVEMLKNINWGEIDIITIGYGTNDYMGNAFIKGDEISSFPYEWNYFDGAIRYSMRTIMQAFPHIKIALITPMYRWFKTSENAFDYDSDDEQSANVRGYILPDYVDSCIRISKELHTICIDNYYDLGINKYNYLQYFYPSDGTHPNYKGRQLRADRIVSQLELLT